MAKKSEVLLVEQVEPLIVDIRSQKVILDRDLATLYGISTKRLKEQVRRNRARFPSDFMFELTKTEFENWRSQNATSNPAIRMGLRRLPYAFTEHGSHHGGNDTQLPEPLR